MIGARFLQRLVRGFPVRSPPPAHSTRAAWCDRQEAPGQVDHLYSYIASSCEVFSLHLAERVRYAKKLEIQLQVGW